MLKWGEGDAEASQNVITVDNAVGLIHKFHIIYINIIINEYR